MKKLLLSAALCLVWTVSALCAEIVLVYPRVPSDTELFVYPDDLDSSFVLGHVSPQEGRLFINGQPVPCTPKGAFLAWLPIEKRDGARNWVLSLFVNGEASAALSVPYTFASDVPESAAPDIQPSASFPQVIRVDVSNAHTRTTIGGSYHIFPDAGCRLRALGHRQGFFEVELGGGLTGVIEDRFVTMLGDTFLPDAYLGDGSCDTDDQSSRSRFSLSRAVPWSADLSADGKSLRVMLYGVKAAIDRIRYDSADDFLTDVAWEQLPAGLALSWYCRAPITRGYEVTCRDGELQVRIRKISSSENRSLRGKRIVLDPGHGGEQDGAIGPLGTREKTVNLEWARLLTQVLRDRGAIVEVTRDADIELDLYERIDCARLQQADCFISLHCNALPDGVNPFLRHGTGTYYYRSGSRTLAGMIHTEILRESGLRDDGLWAANLAVVRPTMFPAVLIEAAYIIDPAEEELLQDESFLLRLSKGVERGLRRYFREESE
ncbi:MAG: N-acetylmuramoyl-L-alanine amidase [bacterium]|nr:N-acetylmuramoyl-L-alanine amidase [bacterium]